MQLQDRINTNATLTYQQVATGAMAPNVTNSPYSIRLKRLVVGDAGTNWVLTIKEGTNTILAIKVAAAGFIEIGYESPGALSITSTGTPGDALCIAEKI